MRKEEKIDFKINKNILKDYVEAINSIKEPMRQIKEQLNQISKPMQELSKPLNEFVKPAAEANYAFESIRKMSEQLKSYSIKYPNEQYKIFTDAIKQIADTNNGMLSTRMIEPLNISRQYLSIMQKNNDIEKIARGIYLTPSAFEDSYFSFQQKYKQIGRASCRERV